MMAMRTESDRSRSQVMVAAVADRVGLWTSGSALAPGVVTSSIGPTADYRRSRVHLVDSFLQVEKSVDVELLRIGVGILLDVPLQERDFGLALAAAFAEPAEMGGERLQFIVDGGEGRGGFGGMEASEVILRVGAGSVAQSGRDGEVEIGEQAE